MYVQKGTQRIEVIVRKESGGGTEGAKTTQPDSVTASGGENTSEQRVGSVFDKKKLAISTGFKLGAIARQMATVATNYYVLESAYARGSQSYKNNVDRKTEIANDVIGTIMGTASGVWVGLRSGGVPGAVIGGFVNATSSIVNIASRHASREQEYKWQIFKDERAIAYNRARAGINFTNGRLR